MTVDESEWTPANVTLQSKRPHIDITTFDRKRPPDVCGDTTVRTPAPRRVRLEFGALRTDAHVPRDGKGRPRTFFQDRNVVRAFIPRAGAKPETSSSSRT